MTINQAFQSQFGIRIHAQIQTVCGGTYEFQPEHLLCDECWRRVDTALAHASHYGTVTAQSADDHAITVTKKQ
jgi:hypothetical protein